MKNYYPSTFLAVLLLVAVQSTSSFAATKTIEPTAEEVALEARVAPHRDRLYTGNNSDELRNAAVKLLNDYGFFVSAANQAAGTVTGVRTVQMSKQQPNGSDQKNSSRAKRPKTLNLSLTIGVSQNTNNQIALEINGTYNGKTALTDVGLLDHLHKEISSNAVNSEVIPLMPLVPSGSDVAESQDKVA